MVSQKEEPMEYDPMPHPGLNFDYMQYLRRNTFYEDWMEVFDKLLPPLR